MPPSPMATPRPAHRTLANSPLGLGSPFALVNVGATDRAARGAEQPLCVIRPPGYPLFLGSYAAASNRSAMQALGITHVVNATCEYENAYPDDFIYLRICAKDTRYERLTPYFAEVAQFVACAQAQNGKVLVHCQHGISRSVTLLVASIMANEHKPLMRVLGPLVLLKGEAEPNPAFMRELRAWEMHLFNQALSTDQLTVSDPLHTDQGLPPTPTFEAALVLASLHAIDRAPALQRAEACQHTIGHVLALPAADRKPAITQMITGIAEAYGAQSPRDGRARSVVGMILTGLQTRGGIDAMAVADVFDAVKQDATWQDFVMDLPHAAKYLREMRADSMG